jgi:tetratricopeptide (TPR) repeat protein
VGLLHLDIKPSNVLLRSDGIARITDFGLATTGERSVQSLISREAVVDYAAGPVKNVDDHDVGKAILRDALFGQSSTPPQATVEGLTLPYASPEQAEGRTVGPGADVWSWAVTVLEMFVGERMWRSGPLAGAALEQALANAWMVVPLPRQLADILTAALRPDLATRPSLNAIADGLARICARARPLRTSPNKMTRAGHLRRLAWGQKWTDPRDLLTEAYKLVGLDFSAGAPYFPSRIGTRRARAIEDLRTLWQARTVLESAPDSPHGRWLRSYVCHDMAVVASLIGDLSGAADYYEEAARALGVPQDDNTRCSLIVILIGQAQILRISRREDVAVECCERVIDLARLVDDSWERHRAVASAMLTRAACTMENEASLVFYDWAANSYRRVADIKGEAKAVADKASRLAAMGRHPEAEPLFRQAEEQLIAFSEGERRPDITVALATMMTNQGLFLPNAERQLQRAEEAALRLGELVEGSGCYELAGELGTAYLAVGRALKLHDRPQEALDAFRRARGFLDQAVTRDGRADVADTLAECFGDESALARDLGDLSGSMELAGRAVALRQWLSQVDRAKTPRRGGVLARGMRSFVLFNAGDMAAALNEYQQVLQRVDNDEGSPVASRIAAAANRGIGEVLYCEGRFKEAIESYWRGIDRLAGEPSAHHDIRALLLESVGAALVRLGQYREALKLLYASAHEFEHGDIRAVSQSSEMAQIQQNIVNALMTLGDYKTACDLANKTLRLFDDLLAQGRGDLATETARLRAAYGVILRRLLNLDEAAESMTRARDYFFSVSTDDGESLKRASGFDSLLHSIDELRTSTAEDMPAMVAKMRSSMDEAVGLSRAGDPYHASMLLEDALDELRWLSKLVGGEEVIALCGEAGLNTGVTAIICGRDAAAHRGFAVSVQCHDILLEHRRTVDYLEAWFKGQVGMASVHLIAGDKQTSEKVIAYMDSRLAVLDPSHRAQWMIRAQEALDGLRIEG